MKRYSRLLGLPVISIGDGRKLGTVRDIVFRPEKKDTAAFIVESGGIGITGKAVLFDDVVRFGRDAILVDGQAGDGLYSMKRLADAGRLDGCGKLIGLRIFSRNGDDLGSVADVLINQVSGAIEGLIAGNGIVQDIVKGRNILPVSADVEFGEDSILVGRDTAEDAVDTGGGIANRIYGTGKDG